MLEKPNSRPITSRSIVIATPQWSIHPHRKDRDLSARYPQRLRELIAATEKWSRSHTQPRWFDSTKGAESWRSMKMPNYENTFDAEGAKIAVP